MSEFEKCRCPGGERTAIFNCTYCFTQQQFELAEAAMLTDPLPHGWTPYVAMAHVLYWRNRVNELTSRRARTTDVAALFDAG